MALDSAKRVISGTWGTVWMDDEMIAEIYGGQAKVGYNKEEVPLCGQMGVDTKVTSYKGTGTLKIYKVYSRMASARGDDLKDGKDKRYKITMKLADPDSYGAESVTIYDASFDDLTLMDFEAKAISKEECPFTFVRWEFNDYIAVQ